MTDIIKEFQGEYRFLSNFWPSEVILDGLVYPTVEHAYQAAKTIDDNEREFIRNAKIPGEAKRLGRNITMRHDWDNHKVFVMVELVYQKFNNPLEMQLLLATGTIEIQEGNRWGDTFWGVDLKTGKGQNVLGKIIMQVREDLMPKIESFK